MGLIHSLMLQDTMHANSMNETLCPCKNCQNLFWHSLEVVNYVHLLKFGMSVTYDIWVYHGEYMTGRGLIPPVQVRTNEVNSNLSNMFDDVFHRTDGDKELMEQ
ncbi:hypothetical protein PRUPE_1G092800 [Prunus persica]|uniref:Transposase-associated domain-containing protein n=1 Tax=Prunus persica TaxID=3760 RepID=A0A251QUY3_PRUPE|nr:hypothetical protein PRUPE_1G092800 [Prunus persica]